MSTTAEIFAQYLSLTPQNAGWAFGYKEILQCLSCLKDVREVPVEEQAFMATRCDYCCEYLSSGGIVERLTATSPLAVKPTPGWLEVLVNYPSFYAIDRCDYNAFCASIGDDDNPDCPTKAEATHPTRAVALALLAADPDLRARCEAASDAQLLSATNENQPHA